MVKRKSKPANYLTVLYAKQESKKDSKAYLLKPSLNSQYAFKPKLKNVKAFDVSFN